MESSGKRANTPTSEKKRKRPASISPRRGKKRLSLSEVRKHVNSPKQAKKSDPSTSCANLPRSIESFFAKAKPPQYTECPVCSEQVKLSEINRHLDSGCLSQQDSPTKAEYMKQSARKVADVRNDVKDKRTRLRLQDKFESSPLYQPSSSSLSSDDNIESSVQDHDSGCSRLSSGKLNMKRSRVVAICKTGAGQSNHSKDRIVQSSPSSKKHEKQERRTKARSRLSLKKIRERKSDSDSTFDSEVVCNATKEEASKAEDKSREKKVTSPYFKRKSVDSANIISPKNVDTSSVQSTGIAAQNLQKSLSTSAGRPGGLPPPVLSRRHTPTQIYTPVSPASKESSLSSSLQQGYSSKKGSSSAFATSSTDSNRGSAKAQRTPVRTKLFCNQAKTKDEPVSSLTSEPSITLLKSRLSGDSASISLSTSPSSDIAEDTSLSSSPGPCSLLHPKPTMPTSHTSATSSYNSPSKSNSIMNNQGSSLSSSKEKSAFESPVKTSLLLTTTPKKGPSYTSPAKSGSSATSPARSDTLGSPHKPREPYYIVNFKLILNAVLKNKFDSHLFDEEDHAQVTKFNCLSSEFPHYFEMKIRHVYLILCVMFDALSDTMIYKTPAPFA